MTKCRFDVQYQVYQMLEFQGEPCNAKLDYSLDDCIDEERFKVDIHKLHIGSVEKTLYAIHFLGINEKGWMHSTIFQ